MLTPQQRKALLFIEAEIDRSSGVAPTIREIAQHMRYRSSYYAHKLVLGLEERGFIRRIPHRMQAIEVVRPVTRVAAFVFNPDSKRLEMLRTK